MPQYLSPGVYVEEVKSSVQPIAGVGTSTAGFIGQVDSSVGNKMPIQPGKFEVDSLGHEITDSLNNKIPAHYTLVAAGVPTLITSWEQFKNRFGDFQSGNKTLAHAIYGFFNNGGTRCWVVRTDGSANATIDALAQFEAIDEIALVVVPGATDAAVQSAVISHCENMGDRFAILDGQNTATLTPAAIQGQTGDSNYAAMYYPRIQVFDPDPAVNGPAYVFPSGHIAGIYARVDTLRGVHKAPANEVIRGALGVERRLSRADQDGLNPDGINVIRELNGNILVWGARTLGGDANGEWKYINVRRLFLFLRESIDEGTQWVVFEPNDTALWSKISRNVTAFLTNVWRSGALFGNSPQEAFYVRCDAATNPPEVRDLGQVVTEIGVAVVKPAEFVIFRISQWAGPGK
ncbi:MAG TPA: phage tail sheath subtilisin-like domain-containing protein [Thermoanaerobaculia bacterium]|nr:phage tail sheath subtilisin-like domain-containing protein [Thermoanaerobaculia bacterium]